MKIVSTPNAPAAIGPYAQAVRSGNFLFLSGQLGLDPATKKLAGDDIETQAAQALKNLAAVLEAEGLTYSNIVKTTIFLTDLADFSKVNALYAEAFGSHTPARSTVEVAGLPLGGKVEIEGIAIAE